MSFLFLLIKQMKKSFINIINAMFANKIPYGELDLNVSLAIITIYVKDVLIRCCNQTKIYINHTILEWLNYQSLQKVFLVMILNAMVVSKNPFLVFNLSVNNVLISIYVCVFNLFIGQNCFFSRTSMELSGPRHKADHRFEALYETQ